MVIKIQWSQWRWLQLEQQWHIESSVSSGDCAESHSTEHWCKHIQAIKSTQTDIHTTHQISAKIKLQSFVTGHDHTNWLDQSSVEKGTKLCQVWPKVDEMGWETQQKKYQQYKCRSCSVNFTRTYCVCTVGEWLCKTCLPKHVLQKMTGIKSACNQTIVDICDKHTLTTAPKNAAFYSKDQQRWVIACKNEHQKHKCQLCCVRLHKNGSFYIQKVNQWGEIATTTTTDVNYCRTHCSCNPSKWMCLDCHASVHTMFICPASIVRHN